MTFTYLDKNMENLPKWKDDDWKELKILCQICEIAYFEDFLLFPPIYRQLAVVEVSECGKVIIWSYKYHGSPDGKVIIWSYKYHGSPDGKAHKTAEKGKSEGGKKPETVESCWKLL